MLLSKICYTIANFITLNHFLFADTERQNHEDIE